TERKYAARIQKRKVAAGYGQQYPDCIIARLVAFPDLGPDDETPARYGQAAAQAVRRPAIRSTPASTPC
ncbi:MAG TPA: hypothetical protein V6D08_10205, partial [Candidatus Obscuribacterales bacterium]